MSQLSFAEGDYLLTSSDELRAVSIGCPPSTQEGPDRHSVSSIQVQRYGPFPHSHTWRDYRMFTALAAKTATVASEINDCTIIMSFAHRERTGVSVGENAVLVVKARNK